MCRVQESQLCLSYFCRYLTLFWLIVLGFNDTSTLVGHFVSSSKEREKREERDSRRDERNETEKKEEQEWKWRIKRNKTISPLPLPATRIAGHAQL